MIAPIDERYEALGRVDPPPTDSTTPVTPEIPIHPHQWTGR